MDKHQRESSNDSLQHPLKRVDTNDGPPAMDHSFEANQVIRHLSPK